MADPKSQYEVIDMKFYSRNRSSYNEGNEMLSDGVYLDEKAGEEEAQEGLVSHV